MGYCHVGHSHVGRHLCVSVLSIGIIVYALGDSSLPLTTSSDFDDFQSYLLYLGGQVSSRVVVVVMIVVRKTQQGSGSK